MKKIALTKGKYALVDDTDFEWLNQWKWYTKESPNTSYAVRKQYLETRDGKELYETIYMARLIMDAPKYKQVDHRDCNGLNNQRDNLRICTRSENLLNRGKQRNNSSGHKNIYWHKQNSMWRVRLTSNGIVYDGGLHHSVETAIQTRDYLVKKINGDFARTRG